MAGPLIKIIDSKKSMFDYVPGCGAGIQKNEMNLNAKGGTELMQQRMWDNLVEAGHEELLDKFQVIPSRVRELDPDRIRLLWCHDLAEDGEVQFLKDEGCTFLLNLRTSRTNLYGVGVNLMLRRVT